MWFGELQLPIAQQSTFVVGVEGVDEMVQQATSNAILNQLSNTEFYQANLEERAVFTSTLGKERFDKILLDPAHKERVGSLNRISGLGAKRVVIFRANPATLARNSESLEKQGYQLAKLGMLDMFPPRSDGSLYQAEALDEQKCITKGVGAARYQYESDIGTS